MTKQCVVCADEYSYVRYRLGYHTCLSCGEQAARQRKHCIVPMHKSNYVPVTNLDDLKGINNKGGFFR
jgi:hypothetical protein